jgi:hypothetical protein
VRHFLITSLPPGQASAAELAGHIRGHAFQMLGLTWNRE